MGRFLAAALCHAVCASTAVGADPMLPHTARALESRARSCESRSGFCADEVALQHPLVLGAAWGRGTGPVLWITSPSSARLDHVRSLSVYPERGATRAGRYLPFSGACVPREWLVVDFPPDFAVVFISNCAWPADDSEVFRHSPSGWATQPYASLNRRFLRERVRFGLLGEAGPEGTPLLVVNGQRERLAAVNVPVTEWSGDRLCSPVLLQLNRHRIWGCVGTRTRASQLRRALCIFEVDPDASGERHAATWWVSHGQSCLDDAAGESGLAEEVAFLPPSLSASPETGLAVWRKRTVSSEQEQATATIYELIHWTPDREQLVGLYAEYRGPGGERSWRFDERGEWIERPYIRWPQIAKKLGIEPWPVCAIAPDGKQILYTCACDLRVVTVPD